jgi:hypothetical protein
MIENVEKGMTIYFYRDLDSYIIKGKVKDSSITKTGSIKFVNWEAIIDDGGKEIKALGGTSSVRLDKAFLTAKEAYDTQKEKFEKYKNELRKEITDVESLLKFSLKHCVSNSEYTDWIARDIYDEYIEKYKKGELK